MTTDWIPPSKPSQMKIVNPIKRDLYTWCWWPRRSSGNRKSLWLKKAYRVRRTYGSYGGDISIDEWYSEEEFIIMRLKDEI